MIERIAGRRPWRRFILPALMAWATFAPSAFAGGACIGPGEKGLSIQHLESRTDWTEAQIETALSDAEKLGVRWLRVGVAWGWVQPVSGAQWNFGFADDIVARARRHGLRLLIQIIDPTPGWALRDPRDSSVLPTERIADFATFARRMAERYAPLGVHHWEIFNEFNARYTAQQYGDVLKAAYLSIHDADPDSIVMVGGLITRDSTALEGPVSFMQHLYDAGFGAYFDAVAMHPYTWEARLNAPGTNWSDMNGASPSVRSIMSDHGDAQKKIWITEMGFPTRSEQSPWMTEATQAQWISNVYASAAKADWLGPVFWYSYRDERARDIGSEAYFGLRRYDFTKKAGYAAFRDAPDAGNACQTIQHSKGGA